MMRKAWLVTWLFLVMVPASSYGRAQMATLVEVFVDYDAQTGTAILHFANPASGLSTPVALAAFRQDALIVDELTVTPDGVLFRDPVEGLVMVATAEGRVSPHPFIPRQRSGLLAVDWVISPDGNSIAWAESFLRDGSWVSNMYVADLAGRVIAAVPPPPPSTVELFRRVVPLAVTNDRGVVFYDNAFRTDPSPLAEYFVTYREIYAFSFGSGRHDRLPGEPGCACGAGTSSDGFRFIRLAQTDSGFQAQLVDLTSGTVTVIPAVGERFGQAGDVLWVADQNIVYYTQAQNMQSVEQSRQFALMQVDLLAGTQRIVVGPTSHRLRALSMSADGDSLLVVDVYEGGTYKLDLPSQKLSLVSESIWLGTIRSR